MNTPSATAARLLDAQVAWIVSELSGDRLPEVIERELDAVLSTLEDVRLDSLSSPESVRRVLEVVLRTTPASIAVTEMSHEVADLVRAGPTESFRPADVIDREQVGALVDALLPLRPLLAQLLDRLTESPAVGTLASGFVTKIVIQALEANKSLTKRIPGVRSIVSAGTSAATKMVGAADAQMQALFGDSAGKGAAMAVKRLNTVLLQTLDDPLLRDAVLETWEAQGTELLDGIGDVTRSEDVRALAGVLQDLVATGLSSAPALAFLDAAVRPLFAMYGPRPIGVLLDELSLSRDDLLTIATAVVTPVVHAGLAEGWLEAAVRERLAPFYASQTVAAILTS